MSDCWYQASASSVAEIHADERVVHVGARVSVGHYHADRRLLEDIRRDAADEDVRCVHAAKLVLADGEGAQVPVSHSTRQFAAHVQVDSHDIGIGE